MESSPNTPFAPPALPPPAIAAAPTTPSVDETPSTARESSQPSPAESLDSLSTSTASSRHSSMPNSPSIFYHPILTHVALDGDQRVMGEAHLGCSVSSLSANGSTTLAALALKTTAPAAASRSLDLVRSALAGAMLSPSEAGTTTSLVSPLSPAHVVQLLSSQQQQSRGGRVSPLTSWPKRATSSQSSSQLRLQLQLPNSQHEQRQQQQQLGADALAELNPSLLFMVQALRHCRLSEVMCPVVVIGNTKAHATAALATLSATWGATSSSSSASSLGLTAALPRTSSSACDSVSGGTPAISPHTLAAVIAYTSHGGANTAASTNNTSSSNSSGNNLVNISSSSVMQLDSTVSDHSGSRRTRLGTLLDSVTEYDGIDIGDDQAKARGVVKGREHDATPVGDVTITSAPGLQRPSSVANTVMGGDQASVITPFSESVTPGNGGVGVLTSPRHFSESTAQLVHLWPLLYANDTALNLLGYHRLDDVMAKEMDDVFRCFVYVPEGEAAAAPKQQQQQRPSAARKLCQSLDSESVNSTSNNDTVATTKTNSCSNNNNNNNNGGSDPDLAATASSNSPFAVTPTTITTAATAATPAAKVLCRHSLSERLSAALPPPPSSPPPSPPPPPPSLEELLRHSDLPTTANADGARQAGKQRRNRCSAAPPRASKLREIVNLDELFAPRFDQYVFLYSERTASYYAALAVSTDHVKLPKIRETDSVAVGQRSPYLRLLDSFARWRGSSPPSSPPSSAVAAAKATAAPSSAADATASASQQQQQQQQRQPSSLKDELLAHTLPTRQDAKDTQKTASAAAAVTPSPPSLPPQHAKYVVMYVLQRIETGKMPQLPARPSVAQQKKMRAAAAAATATATAAAVDAATTQHQKQKARCTLADTAAPCVDAQLLQSQLSNPVPLLGDAAEENGGVNVSGLQASDRPTLSPPQGDPLSLCQCHADPAVTTPGVNLLHALEPEEAAPLLEVRPCSPCSSIHWSSSIASDSKTMQSDGALTVNPTATQGGTQQNPLLELSYAPFQADLARPAAASVSSPAAATMSSTTSVSSHTSPTSVAQSITTAHRQRQHSPAPCDLSAGDSADHSSTALRARLGQMSSSLPLAPSFNLLFTGLTPPNSLRSLSAHMVHGNPTNSFAGTNAPHSHHTSSSDRTPSSHSYALTATAQPSLAAPSSAVSWRSVQEARSVEGVGQHVQQLPQRGSRASMGPTEQLPISQYDSVSRTASGNVLRHSRVPSCATGSGDSGSGSRNASQLLGSTAAMTWQRSNEVDQISAKKLADRIRSQRSVASVATSLRMPETLIFNSVAFMIFVQHVLRFQQSHGVTQVVCLLNVRSKTQLVVDMIPMDQLDDASQNSSHSTEYVPGQSTQTSHSPPTPVEYLGVRVKRRLAKMDTFYSEEESRQTYPAFSESALSGHDSNSVSDHHDHDVSSSLPSRTAMPAGSSAEARVSGEKVATPATTPAATSNTASTYREEGERLRTSSPPPPPSSSSASLATAAAVTPVTSVGHAVLQSRRNSADRGPHGIHRRGTCRSHAHGRKTEQDSDSGVHAVVAYHHPVGMVAHWAGMQPRSSVSGGVTGTGWQGKGAIELITEAAARARVRSRNISRSNSLALLQSSKMNTAAAASVAEVAEGCGGVGGGFSTATTPLASSLSGHPHVQHPPSLAVMQMPGHVQGNDEASTMTRNSSSVNSSSQHTQSNKSASSWSAQSVNPQLQPNYPPLEWVPKSEYLSTDTQQNLAMCDGDIIVSARTYEAQVRIPFITPQRLELLSQLGSVQLSSYRGLSVFGVNLVNMVTEEVAAAAAAAAQPTTPIIPLQYGLAACKYKDAVEKSTVLPPLDGDTTTKMAGLELSSGQRQQHQKPAVSGDASSEKHGEAGNIIATISTHLSPGSLKSTTAAMEFTPEAEQQEDSKTTTRATTPLTDAAFARKSPPSTKATSVATSVPSPRSVSCFAPDQSTHARRSPTRESTSVQLIGVQQPKSQQRQQQPHSSLTAHSTVIDKDSVVSVVMTTGEPETKATATAVGEKHRRPASTLSISATDENGDGDDGAGGSDVDVDVDTRLSPGNSASTIRSGEPVETTTAGGTGVAAAAAEMDNNTTNRKQQQLQQQQQRRSSTSPKSSRTCISGSSLFGRSDNGSSPGVGPRNKMPAGMMLPVVLEKPSPTSSPPAAAVADDVAVPLTSKKDRRPPPQQAVVASPLGATPRTAKNAQQSHRPRGDRRHPPQRKQQLTEMDELSTYSQHTHVAAAASAADSNRRPPRSASRKKTVSGYSFSSTESSKGAQSAFFPEGLPRDGNWLVRSNEQSTSLTLIAQTSSPAASLPADSANDKSNPSKSSPQCLSVLPSPPHLASVQEPAATSGTVHVVLNASPVSTNSCTQGLVSVRTQKSGGTELLGYALSTSAAAALGGFSTALAKEVTLDGDDTAASEDTKTSPQSSRTDEGSAHSKTPINQTATDDDAAAVPAANLPPSPKSSRACRVNPLDPEQYEDASWPDRCTASSAAAAAAGEPSTITPCVSNSPVSASNFSSVSTSPSSAAVTGVAQLSTSRAKTDSVNTSINVTFTTSDISGPVAAASDAVTSASDIAVPSISAASSLRPQRLQRASAMAAAATGNHSRSSGSNNSIISFPLGSSTHGEDMRLAPGPLDEANDSFVESFMDIFGLASHPQRLADLRRQVVERVRDARTRSQANFESSTASANVFNLSPSRSLATTPPTTTTSEPNAASSPRSGGAGGNTNSSTLHSYFSYMGVGEHSGSGSGSAKVPMSVPNISSNSHNFDNSGEARDADATAAGEDEDAMRNPRHEVRAVAEETADQIMRHNLHVLVYALRVHPEMEEVLGIYGHCTTFVTSPMKMLRYATAGLQPFDVLIVEWIDCLITPEIHNMLAQHAVNETVVVYFISTRPGARTPTMNVENVMTDTTVVIHADELLTGLLSRNTLGEVQQLIRRRRLLLSMVEMRMQQSFQIVSQIGSGAFGDVFEVFMYVSRGKLAMKRIFLKSMKLRQLELINREVCILRALEHPNIVSFSHTQLEDNAFSIFMELCDGSLAEHLLEPSTAIPGAAKRQQHRCWAPHLGGPDGMPAGYEGSVVASLSSKLTISSASRSGGDNGAGGDERNASLNETTNNGNDGNGCNPHISSFSGPTLTRPQDAVMIVHDIASALVYLHGRGIIHRDIKPANILFSNGMAKLADFGSAVKMNESRQLRNMKGTMSYMAPEMVLGEPYTEACDLWSFGCLIASIMGIHLGHLSGLHMPALNELYRSIPINSSLPLTCSNRLSSQFENHYTESTTNRLLSALKRALANGIEERERTPPSLTAPHAQQSSQSQSQPQPQPPHSSTASQTTGQASGSLGSDVGDAAMQERRRVIAELGRADAQNRQRSVMCISTTSIDVLGEFPVSLPASLVELFENLFHRDPSKRMTAADILDHPVSWDVEWMTRMMNEVQMIYTQLSINTMNARAAIHANSRSRATATTATSASQLGSSASPLRGAGSLAGGGNGDTTNSEWEHLHLGGRSSQGFGGGSGAFASALNADMQPTGYVSYFAAQSSNGEEMSKVDLLNSGEAGVNVPCSANNYVLDLSLSGGSEDASIEE